jgi:hypothetical protein
VYSWHARSTSLGEWSGGRLLAGRRAANPAVPTSAVGSGPRPATVDSPLTHRSLKDTETVAHLANGPIARWAGHTGPSGGPRTSGPSQSSEGAARATSRSGLVSGCQERVNTGDQPFQLRETAARIGWRPGTRPPPSAGTVIPPCRSLLDGPGAWSFVSSPHCDLIFEPVWSPNSACSEVAVTKRAMGRPQGVESAGAGSSTRAYRTGGSARRDRRGTRTPRTTHPSPPG